MPELKRHAATPLRSRLRSSLSWGALAWGVQLLSACSGANHAFGTNYAETAKENLELAREEFDGRDWEGALLFADHVRVRFPFSKYAVEAELLAARARFEGGEYLLAQDAFRQFARLHPTHKHVRDGWADYMVIVSAYLSMPESSWPLPPHSQLDQSSLRRALMEMKQFLVRYPESPMHRYALDLQGDILRKLLEHELYVARYYLDRGKPRSAIGRLKLAHKQFPGIGMDAEIQFLLGLTYLRMGEVELSRDTMTELLAEHPSHHKGKQAGVYLDYIQETYGPPDPGRIRPDPPDLTPKRPPQLKPGSLGPHDQRAPQGQGAQKTR